MRYLFTRISNQTPWEKLSSFWLAVYEPWVPGIIYVLRIPTDGNTLCLGYAVVDGIHARVAEGIDPGLEVGQGPAVAGLDASVVARGVDVKDGDGAQDGVGILARAVRVRVDVGDEVLAVPVGFLQEAGHLRSLVAADAFDAEGLGQRFAFDEGAELVLRREEAGSPYLLPEVESGGIPLGRKNLATCTGIKPPSF